MRPLRGSRSVLPDGPWSFSLALPAGRVKPAGWRPLGLPCAKARRVRLEPCVGMPRISPIAKYCSPEVRSRSGGDREWRRLGGLFEAVHERGELVAGEVPCERLRDLVVVVLEVVERAGDGGGVLEVVGIKDLALDDRVVDLDLVEPAAMHGGVHEDQVRPAVLEAVDTALSAVVGAVVDDPEHAWRGRVGLLGHDLPDEPVERGDAALGLAAAHDLAAAHIPRVQVGDRAFAPVLVLDALPATASRRRAWVDPLARLDRGLGVGADDAVAGLQQLAFPAAGVEVENRSGPFEEPRIAGEDPGALLPGLDRILAQPTPDRRRRRLADGLLDDEAVQLRPAEARQRDAVRLGQLARDRLDLRDLGRGKSAAGDPTAVDPAGPQGAVREIVAATARRPSSTSQAARRSPHSTCRRPRRAPPSRAARRDTKASASQPA